MYLMYYLDEQGNRVYTLEVRRLVCDACPPLVNHWCMHRGP
jgi:hypothetical protein